VRHRTAALLLFGSISIAAAVFRVFGVLDPAGPVANVERRVFAWMNSDENLLLIVEQRFADHAAATLLHVVPGALFLALAPLQFSSRFRSRHLRFHRWSGRLLLVAVAVSAVTGLFFGVVIPIAGFGEASSTGVFGALILFAIVRGYLAVRRGDLARHREWMIRAFAIAIGVSTIRLIAAVMQLIVKTTPERTVAISFWTGWAVTLLAAELWIRATSTSARTYSSTVPDTGSASG
jgi:uncharacterized membrane protein